MYWPKSDYIWASSESMLLETRIVTLSSAKRFIFEMSNPPLYQLIEDGVGMSIDAGGNENP